MSRQAWQGCLVLPSGGSVVVKYLNGLQVFGFCLAFFGLVGALLGLLDVVIIPAFHTVETHHYPIQPDLGNSYGLPIFSGILVAYVFACLCCFQTIASGAMALRTTISERYTSLRKFYISLWFVLLANVVYWCCFIVAICEGLLSLPAFMDKTSSLLLVTRIFTAVNSSLTLVPCLAGLTLYSLPVLGIHCNPCDCCRTGSSWSRLAEVDPDGTASRLCCCCRHVAGSSRQPCADGEDDDSSLASHQVDVTPFRL
ncbi:hypothetical protein P879_10938 [Paragonimus westermani]|uniref:Uncharacterized protein n=1 Tax=Paragonimus westermani TaxID=34504 RepID=A0A8T0D7I9_9TREM|nr:hypothetical protein P879_10938 [Paragonimus westermani]